MPRVTRSGAEFSPWQDNLPAFLTALSPTRSFEIIKTKTSISSLLQQRLAEADLQAQRADNNLPPDDDWEDVPMIFSRPPSPLTDLSSSSNSSRATTPSPHPPSAPPTPSMSPSRPSASSPCSAAVPPPGGIEKQRLKDHAAKRRKAKRQANAHNPYNRPTGKRPKKQRELSPVHCSYRLADAPHSAGGSWIGHSSGVQTEHHFTLPELLEEGCEEIEWNGRDPKLIVDADGRIIAILLGTPDDPDWPDVVRQAIAAMAEARRKARRHGVWTKHQHRRGSYFVLNAGVSFGGGQKWPGNLANSRFYRHLIHRLLRNKAIQRLAGFQSSGLALYAPKLYRYYRRILRRLFDHHPELIHNFRNSIFPVTTFNCGPDAVTIEHLDKLNVSHGLCAITSGGRFDHTRGGHLHLRQIRLVIQFPSGASVLIPSGCVDHGNTPIQPGEERHSMTQYAAGGLFRWVAYGFKTAKDLLAQKDGDTLRAAFDGTPGSRWKWALNLFSKLDELDADRATLTTD